MREKTHFERYWKCLWREGEWKNLRIGLGTPPEFIPPPKYKEGQRLVVKDPDGNIQRGTITKIFHDADHGLCYGTTAIWRKHELGVYDCDILRLLDEGPVDGGEVTVEEDGG